MLEFFSQVAQFTMSAIAFGKGILILAILFVCLLIALAILAAVKKRAKPAATDATNLNLVKLHKELTFTPSPAISSLQPALHKVKKIKADVSDEGKVTVVLRFEGDTMASGRNDFASMVDEVLANREKIKRVLVVVNSPGGGVAHYGQMYAEMERIRNAGLELIALVDTYAASGGYLMSVPAHRIVAAPFAIVGSIGVVSEFVNVHKLLTNMGIQPLTITAGNLKRTVTPLSEVTDEAVSAYKKQLEAIHSQFIAVVKKYRNVDEEKVCNGNHWTAAESVALELNLVDELATSSDYLFRANQEESLVFISKSENPYEKGLLRLTRRLSASLVDSVVERLRGQL